MQGVKQKNEDERMRSWEGENVRGCAGAIDEGRGTRDEGTRGLRMASGLSEL